MKLAAYPEQRCSACRAHCRTICRAPCRTHFGLLACTPFGIWFGGAQTGTSRDSRPRPAAR